METTTQSKHLHYPVILMSLFRIYTGQFNNVTDDEQAPSDKTAIKFLISRGMAAVAEEGELSITPRGLFFVEHILNIPFPEVEVSYRIPERSTT